LSIGRTEYFENLQDDQREEINIGDSSELLEQVFRQESDDGIFRSPDLVPDVSNDRITRGVHGVIG